MENTLNFLSRRAGFNTALRHFKCVNAFAADVGGGYNLADVLNEALEDQLIERYQVRAILNVLLVDKLKYVTRSHNLESSVDDAADIVGVTSQWGKIHLVFCYHHPQAGLFVINPANPAHWEGALPLVHDEYALLLVGPATDTIERKTLDSAADDFLKILYGRKVKDDGAYRGNLRVLKSDGILPSFQDAEAATASASRSGRGKSSEPREQRGSRRKITPKLSVVVTNELFHNGNVEAWKKIIASFRAKYPDLDVLIWYEDERINDINSLFKWGKVKHGAPVMFSVAGDEIRDVRKLQRYLYEGASPRFEAFLKGGFDQVLDLF